MSKPTVEAYDRWIFSMTSRDSVRRFIVDNYPNRQLCDYVFELDKNFCQFRENFLQHIAQCPSASVGNMVTNAMICFLKYLSEVAKEIVIPKDDKELQHRFNRDDYLRNLDDLCLKLKEKCKPLKNLANSEAKSKRYLEELADPGTSQHRNQAYTRYFKSAHFDEKCALLAKWALPNQDEEISEVDFNYLSRWMMWNAIMCDGKRPQNAKLFKNKHFLERIHGSVATFEKDNHNIKFNRDVYLSKDDVHCYCIGRAELDERGKTGPTDLMLPYSLAIAMECYHALKGRLFKEKAMNYEEPFFVDFKGKQLNMDGIDKSIVVKEICRLMGVSHLTPNNNRHGMATRMAQIGPVGDTGMEHTPDTQITYYNDRGQEQGVMNKRLANAAMFTAEVADDGQLNPELEGLLKENRLRDSNLASSTRQKQAADARLKIQTEGTRNRGGRKGILSEEKMRYIASIWSGLSPEMTGYVFCSADYPRLSSFHEAIFKRFLFSDSDGMDNIREDVANICTRFPKEPNSTLIKKLIHLIKESIKAFNRTRQERAPVLHVILNFTPTIKRFTKENEKLNQVYEKYSGVSSQLRGALAVAVENTVTLRVDHSDHVKEAIATALEKIPKAPEPPASSTLVEEARQGLPSSSSGFHNPKLAKQVQDAGKVKKDQYTFGDSEEEETGSLRSVIFTRSDHKRAALKRALLEGAESDPEGEIEFRHTRKKQLKTATSTDSPKHDISGASDDSDLDKNYEVDEDIAQYSDDESQEDD